MNWIDNADSYKCPVCFNEVGNPIRYGYRCPVCGFVADQDKEYADNFEYRGDFITHTTKCFLCEEDMELTDIEKVYIRLNKPIPPRICSKCRNIWKHLKDQLSQA